MHLHSLRSVFLKRQRCKLVTDLASAGVAQVEPIAFGPVQQLFDHRLYRCVQYCPDHELQVDFYLAVVLRLSVDLPFAAHPDHLALFVRGLSHENWYFAQPVRVP